MKADHLGCSFMHYFVLPGRDDIEFCDEELALPTICRYDLLVLMNFGVKPESEIQD